MIETEIYKDLMKPRQFDWIQTASAEDRLLLEKIYEFADLFEDMTFSTGTPTHKFIACQSRSLESEEWIDDEVPLPDEIAYFSYDYFTYHVEDLGEALGRFSIKDFSLSVSPANLDNTAAILHEMIHLHEFVIDGLPLFFHDAIFWCLYKDLKLKICDLDDRIESYGHIFNSQEIMASGGTHDILFLLKSFDLDIKQGYPLGTVFGYGMADN